MEPWWLFTSGLNLLLINQGKLGDSSEPPRYFIPMRKIIIVFPMKLE